MDTKHDRALQQEDVGSIGGLSLDGAEGLRCYHSFVNDNFLINGRTMEGDWAVGIKAVTGILIPNNNMQKLSQNWEKSRFSFILVEKTAIFVIF